MWSTRANLPPRSANQPDYGVHCRWGMPITVISKLVGHASLVMTIYYTKVGHSLMRKELAAAEKRAIEQSLDRYQDLIIQKKIDEARPELIATDRTTLDQCLNSDWPAAAFQLMSIGICPVGGAKCDEGGEPLVERKAEAFYAPVPSGYLGTRNCPDAGSSSRAQLSLGAYRPSPTKSFSKLTSSARNTTSWRNKGRRSMTSGTMPRVQARCLGTQENSKKVTAAYEEKAKNSTCWRATSSTYTGSSLNLRHS